MDRAQLWGSSDKARRTADLELAAKLAPDESDVHKLLALDAGSAGDFRRADAELALAAKADPKDTQVQVIHLRNLRLEIIAMATSDNVGRARAIRSDAPLATPRGSDPSHINILARSGKVKEALTLLNDMIRREPNNPDFLNQRCWTKAALDVEVESAVADCDAALKLKPTSPNYLDSRGFARLRVGTLEDALADYDAALTLRPGVAISLFGRAIVKARLALAKSSAADVAAARKIDAKIDSEFASYGLAMPAAPGDGAQP